MNSFEAAQILKQAHRERRVTQPEELRVRIHRAISWLERAELETADTDARFIFLWISLNAAYAREFGHEQSEREEAMRFMRELLAGDSEGRIQAVLFKQFSGPIRTLIDNKFVFEPFWRAMREHDSSEQWKSKFEHAKGIALKAVMDTDTVTVLSVVADRLHVLRNQLVHGGATWNGQANRAQVRDAAAILGTLMPVIIDLMIRSKDADFGAITYPWVK